MLNLKLTCFLLLFAFSMNSQNVKVEKLIWGTQLTPVGLFAYNELRLRNTVALRSEIGVHVSVIGSLEYDLELALEPRWYFSTKRRLRKNKSILGNQGLYLGLRNAITNTTGDGFTALTISTCPLIGLRRMYKKIDFELSIGYQFNSSKVGIENNEHVTFVNDFDLQLRVGYVFFGKNKK